MTRKHFIEIATALRTTNASERTVIEVAKACKRANSSFNYVTFHAAALSPTADRLPTSEQVTR